MIKRRSVRPARYDPTRRACPHGSRSSHWIFTEFSRSGVLTVAAGKSSAARTGVALTSASLVLATLQQDHPGVWIRAAVPNVNGSAFTVHLSKAVPARTKVAWFIVN